MIAAEYATQVPMLAQIVWVPLAKLYKRAALLYHWNEAGSFEAVYLVSEDETLSH